MIVKMNGQETMDVVMESQLLASGVFPPLKIQYKNWNGIFSIRKIIPDYVWFGATEFHKEPQYLLHAWDMEKKEYRDFAIVDILEFIKE